GGSKRLAQRRTRALGNQEPLNSCLSKGQWSGLQCRPQDTRRAGKWACEHRPTQVGVSVSVIGTAEVRKAVISANSSVYAIDCNNLTNEFVVGILGEEFFNRPA